MFGWDWMLIWTALEAIAVAVGVVAIFWQVKRMWEESVQHKFEGFELAAEILSSDRMTGFFKGTHGLTDDDIAQAFMDLEVVWELVDKGYVDRYLVFRYRGRYLAQMYRDVTEWNPAIVDRYKSYAPRAFKLLEETGSWWDKKMELESWLLRESRSSGDGGVTND